MRPRIWLATLVALLSVPAAAGAHAAPRGAVTNAGGAVRVEFTVPVENAFLQVRDAAGNTIPARVDGGDGHAVIVAPTAPGTRLRLRVLSRDGHVTYATVPAVAEPSSGRDPIDAILAHGLVLAGLVGMLGLVSLRFLVVGPAWRSGGPRPPGTGGVESWRQVTAQALVRGSGAWWIALWASGAAAAAGLALGPLALLRELDAGAGGLGTLIADTRWGRSWLVQLVGLAVGLAVAAALRSRPAAREPDPPRGWGLALGVPAAAALVGISIGSHASSGTDSGVGMGIDGIHLLATAAWFGGLLGLALAVPAAHRRLAESDGTRLAAAVVVRFSGLAIACVGVLVVTGVYRAIGELSAVGDLLHTGYGQALSVKLGLFAVLLASGGYNRLVLHPRLERAALGLRESDGGAARRLRVSVLAELTVALGVIAAVAVLVSLPTP